MRGWSVRLAGLVWITQVASCTGLDGLYILMQGWSVRLAGLVWITQVASCTGFYGLYILMQGWSVRLAGLVWITQVASCTGFYGLYILMRGWSVRLAGLVWITQVASCTGLDGLYILMQGWSVRLAGLVWITQREERKRHEEETRPDERKQEGRGDLMHCEHSHLKRERREEDEGRRKETSCTVNPLINKEKRGQQTAERRGNDLWRKQEKRQKETTFKKISFMLLSESICC
ncbi:uncharacterized protein LOC121887711 isoform X3 [Thunnus maccoyii]|uniref:uncharacterized protein LOC121887711 isoform X3 n=1 Tax=Thunnus maccoyii TaxID=8240 RepID=UPI001C4BEA2F|nr:uncharacterized protein LOC121887711 isoform X3 [Thunnus maccoyii]XP_042254557.1 uncharacterized protein LOC121887711 isoform X3 [Thunnus maccoyii]XP_042254558.1 uncharacterized protein LOC121887711 isoform X3 [Thunnus maccoyii]XP_042254559.1 uncharacterized protein LOC121887711 isoform X3 [Thunnus maccoyii]